MSNEKTEDPALAFALYASTAATMAISSLRAADLVDNATINLLLASLTNCRPLIGNEPMLIEHAELLTDLLLEEDAQR